jgi:fatty acid/phospholipid biosynthesis enzyme
MIECVLINHERIEFRHCSEKIEMEDEPVRAIKRKKDSSMVRMAEPVLPADTHPSASPFFTASAILTIELSFLRLIALTGSLRKQLMILKI